MSVTTVDESMLRRDIVWDSDLVPPRFGAYRDQEAWLAWTDHKEFRVRTKVFGSPYFLLVPIFAASSQDGGRFDPVQTPDITCFVF